MAGTAAAAPRWRSKWNLEMAQRSAADWVGLCDVGMAAGSGCGSGFAAADGAAAAAGCGGGGAAAFAGAAAGAVAGSSVMR